MDLNPVIIDQNPAMGKIEVYSIPYQFIDYNIEYIDVGSNMIGEEVDFILTFSVSDEVEDKLNDEGFYLILEVSEGYSLQEKCDVLEFDYSFTVTNES